MGKLSLAEQLQYQKKLNEWKAQKKNEAEAAKAPAGDKGGAGGGDFKELTP